jgi:aminopeptidase-like protein
MAARDASVLRNMKMSDSNMLGWAKDLFPIARSLTGNGVRQTFDYLKGINPEVITQSFDTGTHVFDWTIPREWNIEDAYIEHVATGVRYAEFKRNNLHILGYSLPIDQHMDKADLLPHIYTQEDQPDLIPYVTSYYKDRWGFCMAHNDKQTLPDGEYRAVVKSALTDGELIVGDAKVQGQRNDEIMFSSYICHPSMANNELSGPVLSMALLKYVKDHYQNHVVLIGSFWCPKPLGQSPICRAIFLKCRIGWFVVSTYRVWAMNARIAMLKAVTLTPLQIKHFAPHLSA